MPSTPRCIAVQTATEQYDIHIGAGALAQLGRQARAWNDGRKAFVLTHPSLYELYGGRLSESLRAADYAVESCLVPEGERSKTLRHAARLFTRLARMGADRQSVIFALGGGRDRRPERLRSRQLHARHFHWCTYPRRFWPWSIAASAAKRASITPSART